MVKLQFCNLIDIIAGIKTASNNYGVVREGMIIGIFICTVSFMTAMIICAV
ncbi:MAG: hypothetical protein IJK53_00305 [Erysipelotrichaceae bacterium]|nr:hypothetical protein [Erysipelotrichaceae bacterium]